MFSNRLLEPVLGVARLEDVPEEKLNALVREYPYFAPAHWWLARKTIGTENGDSLLKKAAVFSISPTRLQAYLHEETGESVLATTMSDIETDETTIPVLPTSNTTTIAETNEETPTDDTTVTEAPATTLPITGTEAEEEIFTAPEEGTADDAATTDTAAPPSSIADTAGTETEEAISTPSAEGDTAATETEEDTPTEITETREKEIPTEAAGEITTAEEEAEEQPTDEPLSTTAAETRYTPLIQPLYTEDYFAYTGAKLPEDLDDHKKPTMAQLRSFTDWLRTLKRPAGSTDPDMDPEEAEEARLASGQSSSFIRQIADASLQKNEEVLTEAMAEVRIRQGQPQKAVAIYEKLSLLNPEKSSYFARKIEELQNRK